MICHDYWQTPIGKLEFDKDFQDFIDPERHALEMGYLKNSDGTFEILELSVVPRNKGNDE